MAHGGNTIRLDSLTSLRFFAAAIVLVHHAFRLLMPGSWFAEATSVGYVGVGFFFALSGFVLTWTYKPDMPKRYFYGRRFARIYPLHIATAIVAAVAVIVSGSGIPVVQSALNVLLLHSWIPSESYGSSLNGVSWSLACEAFFYLCFPFLARWAQRWDLRVAAVIVSAFIVVGAIAAIAVLPDGVAQQFLYKNPLYRMGGFVFGILIAVSVRRGKRIRVSVPVALALVAVSLVAAYWATPLLAGLGLPELRVYADLVTLPATCILIAAAANSDLAGMSSWLRNPRLIRLGDASFALYMIHYQILAVWLSIAGVASSMLSGLSQVIVLCIVVVAASVLVFRWFEFPAEKSLRGWLGAPQAAAPTVKVEAASVQG